MNGVAGQTTVTISSSSPPSQGTLTLMGNSIPASSDTYYVGGAEVGLKFYSDVPGTITGIRFYKSPNIWGTHVGELWTVDGQLLASVTFTNESASGWQQVQLPNPVAIKANTTYVVNYHSQGPLSYVPFSTSIDSSPLHAPASGASGNNGVYRLGPVGTFPAMGGGQNYLVDIVFAP
jgi:hypothetical protein